MCLGGRERDRGRRQWLEKEVDNVRSLDLHHRYEVDDQDEMGKKINILRGALVVPKA